MVLTAPAAWAAELTGLPVEPRKGQLVALAAPRGLIRHKLIEAAYMDAVAERDEGLALAVVVEQTLDGDEVLVGSSRERVGFEPGFATTSRRRCWSAPPASCRGCASCA